VGYGASGAAEVNVVDADEDGHLDLAVASFNTGTLWVLIGNGDGTFTANATVLNIGALPWASKTGDLDGDGHADIVYVCRNPDVCRWYLGDGAGGFTLGGTRSTPGFPTSVHLGDLEGDGDLDAVLSRYAAGDFLILGNDGSANFAPPVSLPAVSSGSCTMLVDFDRDGDLDIIGVDETADVGMVYTQTGPTIPGIQQRSCAAAVRINQRGAGDGFGGRPAVPVRVGTSMAVGMSGSPGTFAVLFAGSPATPPLQTMWGPISLNPGYPIIWLAATPLDGHGELRTTIALPAFVPLNFGLCVQGGVWGQDATVLSNPVRFVAVP
jgi:hypothetical protein